MENSGNHYLHFMSAKDVRRQMVFDIVYILMIQKKEKNFKFMEMS